MILIQGKAQIIDESQYLFLLDTKAETLCLDCSVSNCEALFFNAHLFKKLKYLTLDNLDYDLKYVNLFRRLRVLEINSPDSSVIDVSGITEKVSKCKKLRSLTITNSTCKYLGSKRRKKGRYFKGFKKLKTLKLENIVASHTDRLVNDIVWNCKDLDTLVLVESGVNIFNYPERVRGFTIRRKLIGPRLRLLKVDGNLSADKVQDYLQNMPRQPVFSLWSMLNDSKITKAFREPRIRHLVLADNDVDYNKTSIVDSDSLYCQYLFRNWFRSYRVKKLSIDFGDNYLHRDAFRYYEERILDHTRKTGIIETLYLSTESPLNETYMGTLMTGVDDKSELLPWLIEYKLLVQKPFYWDTNSIRERKKGCQYGNGFITPILWKNLSKTPKYFSKNKMKKLTKKYQSFVQLERVKRIRRVRYYRLADVVDNKRVLLPELGFVRNESVWSYDELKEYSFTIRSRRKERIIMSSNLLGAWHTFRALDSTYFLVYKTTSKLDSTKIRWWDMNGDSLKFDFTRQAGVMVKEEQSRDYIRNQKSNQNKEVLSSTRPELGLDRLTLFLKKLNEHQTRKGLRLYSSSEWDDVCRNFKDDPWSFYSNSMFEKTYLPEALSTLGYVKLDQTSWYMQYDSIELFYTQINSEIRTDPNISKVFVFDSDKKTYSIISGINHEGWEVYSATNARYHCILPKRYNPSIRVLLLGDNESFYCSNPHKSYSDKGEQTFKLEPLEIEIISFNTLAKFIEGKL
ncbi:MAG: hypothetical protein COA58_10620 [Bacteroidetes bacterium]|nr:MAG: hypothetical protein COA58_10620 [Bacteroidota bacterium]